MKRLFHLLLGLLLSVTLTGPVAAVTFQSRILYEKVPATLNGLDFEHIQRRPAPMIEVAIYTADASRVLARGRSDDLGEVRIDVPGDPAQVRLAAWAIMGQLQVIDPADDRVHSVLWGAVDPKRRLNYTIPDQNRFSGAFNILAMIRQANRLIERVEPGLRVADRKLTVYWGPDHENGSHYRPSEKAIYLLGQRDVDSDEFDDAVVLHEYGHFITDQFSPFPSLGGPHRSGEKLDPRTAWNEGVATYFGQAMLGNSVKIDTLGPGKASAVDLDENHPEWERTPGYWSEHTVRSALWDFHAGTGFEGEYLGLGFAPIWHVLRGHFPGQVFPYLVSMADGLIQADNRLQAGVTGILAQRQIEYRYGVLPPVALPFPQQIGSGIPISGVVESSKSKRFNLWGSADHYVFRTTREGLVEIRLQTRGASPDMSVVGDANLTLRLYDARGRALAFVDDQKGPTSMERIARALPAGAYVIGVESFLWGGSDWTYSGGRYELTVTHP